MQRGNGAVFFSNDTFEVFDGIAHLSDENLLIGNQLIELRNFGFQQSVLC
ncbi:MAG: Uncharacterised protein [Pseudidiomarina mangrovi]|nr:MAG: Uncharacterised protein [Pseudidiomarina mangrovi]